MKAAPRKTKPVQPAIADVWYERVHGPGQELRHNGRIVALVEPKLAYKVRYPDWTYEVLDWTYRVFDRDGTVVEEATVDHGMQARERAYLAAERLRKQGRV